MFPIFTSLAAFSLALCWSPEWATPLFDARVSCFGVAALLLIQVLSGAAYGREVRRRLPGEPGEFRVRRLARAENAYRFLGLALYASAVANLNWPRVAWQTWHLGGIPGVSLAAALSPYFLFLLATSVGIARAWRSSSGEGPSIRVVLASEARLAALPFVPAFLIVTGIDLLSLNRGIRLLLGSVPFTGIALLAAIMVVTLLTSPSWMPLVLRARPFPDSPLRSDLIRLCERAGVTTPAFWIWPSADSGSVNAMVVGIRSRGRAVFFTESMLQSLSADELGAVLAHELGHVRYRHAAVYACFAMGAVAAVAAAEAALSHLDSDLSRTTLVAALAASIAATFGAFYRRFERQADLFAARLVPANVFIATLEKVASLSGNVRKVWSFTHTSIEQRVNFLLEAGLRPESAARFEHRLSKAVLAGLVVAAFAGGAGIWTAVKQVAAAPVERAKLEAEESAGEARLAWEKGERDGAIGKAAEAAKGDAKWELLVADMLFEAGRAAEARPHYERAKREWRDGTEERAEIEERLELIRGIEERARRK
ncbi:MAG: M48 family metallopeptidase [Planctomycetota bacterium]